VDKLRQDVVAPEVELIPEDDFRSPQPAAVPSPLPEWLVYLRWLVDHRSALGRTAVWALVLSTVVAFLIPKRYQSTVSIMPPDAIGNNSGMITAALAGKASPELAALAGSMLGMKSTGALFVELLRSRTVQNRIVEKFHLQTVYWTNYEEDARKALDGRTGISEDRKSGVITLTVADRTPQRAHDLAQAYVDELNQLVSKVSTSSARRERVFIEQRLASVKSDLEDAEKQFSQFASKNTALDITAQAKAMVEAGASLEGQLIAAQSELQGLQQIYTENNVRVRAARARIDELKRQMQKMGGTDASIASDAPQPGELYPPIRKLPLLGVQWADLYRRVKIQETVYELLNQQYEMARIQEAKEIPTVNVIDPANVPEKKSFPPRLLIIALLTSLALAASIAWIVWEERLEQLDADDPRRVISVKAHQMTSSIAHRLRQNSAVQRFRRLVGRGKANSE
jgi:capsule polysaccharide export protein KpsE/RkpR